MNKYRKFKSRRVKYEKNCQMEHQKTSTKVYLLGSKLNDIDSLIVRDSNVSELIHFSSLNDAKNRFNFLYKILLSPSFKPSIPPSTEELHYHQHFMMLVAFNPVVLEFELADYKNHLLSWRNEKESTFYTQEKFFTTDYWYCPMKTGFIQKFGVLDIAEEIEKTPFIDPDGKMVIRISEISRSTPGTPTEQPKPNIQEKIDKILRDRGFK